MTPDEVAAHLRGIGQEVKARRNGYTAQCTGHDDSTPSLDIDPGTKGAETVVVCRSNGCTTEEILDGAGLPRNALSAPRATAPASPRRKVRDDDYTDVRGGVRYGKERWEPSKDGRRNKDCFFYRDHPGKPRQYQKVFEGPGAPQRVPWRLHLLVKAIERKVSRIFWVEGEPCVEALEALGEVATTAGACGDWRPDMAQWFEGASRVVIIADNDDPGIRHAQQVAAALGAKGIDTEIVRGRVQSKGADIVDHLAAGFTLDDLVPVEGDDLRKSLADAPPAPKEPVGNGTTDPQDEGGERESKRGPSQASQLAALARARYELFMSEDGRPYAVKQDGANIALPLRGKAGLRSQLARLFTDEHGGSVPSQSGLADAMTVLEGVASAADPRVPHLRVARHYEDIVVDLGTADGRCVIVGPDGWRRAPRSPVLFRRSGAMKPLPEPVRDGDGLPKLQGLLNTSEEGFRLLVAWLVACFIPELPHPILTFRGEQGTGKSYAAKMVIGIIDPSGAPKRTAPRDIKSWATQAFNSWALCLDNISTIPDWLSDALCRAVTGDGIVDRALYTDDDVVVLEFRRVLAMTTIDAGALAGDLAERLLTIELLLIPDSSRREEGEMDAAYTEAHASILASLFDLLSQVLKVLPDVHLTERPRMADFARILAAVDQVKDWKTLETYKATARDAIADVLDGEPFAQAVVALVDKAGIDGITVTASELLERVPTPDRLPKKWPKDPTRAGGQLKRLAPALRTIGIEVDDSKRGPKPKKQRLYILSATAERRYETAVPASPGGPNEPLTSANRGDATTGASASPLGRAGDATQPQGDADLFSASPNDTASELDEYQRGDAGDAGTAEMHPLSDTCQVCGEPMFKLDPDQTTHPTC